MATVGLPPSPEHTLDRIDNDGHYSCGGCTQCVYQGWAANCRWATREEQANNRRGNVWVDYDGRRQTVSQWAHEYGLDAMVVHSRRAMGWTMEKALTTPVRKRPQPPTPSEIFEQGLLLACKPRDLPENLREHRRLLKNRLDARRRRAA